MKIAEIVNLEDIQLKYLFVSRRALVKAFVVEDPRNRLVAIQENNSLIWCSVNSILKNLGIDRQEAYDKFGIKFPDGTITTIEQSNSLIETLFGESEFSKDLINRLKESETLTIEYLKQEGLSDNTISQGMVDLGWMGSSRYMINQLLGTSIPTYYLGVNYAVFPPNYGEYMSFFESNQIDLGATALLENYYAACIYGTTIGYSKELSEQNYVKPVLGRQKKLMSKNISTTNIEISQQITECLLCIFKKIGIDIPNRENILSKNHLIAWSLLSIEKMLQFNRAEEIEPLENCVEFEGYGTVKRFTIPELYRHVVFGDRISAYDNGSLVITFGDRYYKFFRPIINHCKKMHFITCRLRPSYLKMQFNKFKKRTKM